MNNKNKYIAVLSASAIAAMLLGNNAVKAADKDIYNKDTHEVIVEAKGGIGYLRNFKTVMDCALHADKYDYEYKGQVYSLKTIVDKTENKLGDEFNKALDAIANDSSITSTKVEDYAKTSDELQVESISVINPSTIKVNFNKAIEKLDRADVVVTNAKTSDRQYVKEVKFAEDKKSAEVVFYDALVTKNTYKVVAAGAEKDFDFVIGEVAKIEAETTQVVEAGQATDIKYKALDANGVDITDTAKVKFESTLEVADGKVTLSKDTQGFVYVVAVDKDNKEIARSARITVKAEEAKAVKFLAYTTDKQGKEFNDKEFEVKHSVRKSETNKTLSVFVEDQFGKNSVEKPAILTGVKYESLNKEVALVDQTTGKITPLKVGTVDVRITVGGVNQIVQINVEEDAKVAGLELDKAEVSLSDKLAAGQAVKVTVKDQYSKAIETANQVIKAEVKEGKELITIGETENTDAKGVATFTVKPVAEKEGKAVIEFTHEVTVEGKTTTFKTTLTANVAKAGVVNNYIVEGFEKELDKYAGKDGKNITSMTLSVYGVDVNGVKTGKVDASEVKVYDKDGNEVAGDINANTNDNLQKDGTYKVVAKVGTLKVFEDTFKVVDTTPEVVKPVVSQIKSSIEIGDKELDADKLKTALATAFEVTLNNEKKDFSITEFASDNISVTNEFKVGKATVVVKKVTVDGKAIDVNFILNLTVKDATAPTVSGLKVNDKDVVIGLDGVINLAQEDITSALGVLSEDATITIKLADGTTEEDKAKYEKSVSVTKDVDFAKLIELAGAKDSNINKDTVAKFNGATITLTDAAGNETAYTITVAK